jgi:hypothetical protein
MANTTLQFRCKIQSVGELDGNQKNRPESTHYRQSPPRNQEKIVPGERLA